ncbi:ABC transporter ATP-binding protein [Burkholderia sp. lig30]|jgi:ABC-type polysaccharide/polyol phosphate transport system ATPase subunit|uniref:ABC transporter ATP-binding protein n=1 Tax=Burkholderia sp. lig30 TaxID=1192124 RepID=UPI0013655186|nr:ABC transporter ATP-binding protein [Burkholderia sp. lig30]
MEQGAAADNSRGLPGAEGTATEALGPRAVCSGARGDAAIRISHVTKRYRIYPTPWNRMRDAMGWTAQYKEFDALHDVSFDIHRGEFWGILGRNGSGKSTLLKMVAGHLQPTSGTIDCAGRVTLLQLGLGFDPELTGLENIRHSRMLQNLSSDFEEIEDFVREFSELGDFINYPVKTYSSGMHSRLGFATAVAGDPDILIADEVLAVGDMSFSQKCLAKMREFKERGKTVVLVTHDVNAVKSFCDHAVWLNDGRMITLGPAKLVADDFRNFMLYGVISDLSTSDGEASGESSVADEGGTAAVAAAASSQIDWLRPNAGRRTVSNGKIEIERYRFIDYQTREVLTSWRPGGTLEFQIVFRALEPCVLHSFAFTLHDRNGMIALHLNSEFFGVGAFEPEPSGAYEAAFRFDAPQLAGGEYSISFGCSEGREGVLMEKYDYDSAVQVNWEKSDATDRQGGYVIVPAGSFNYKKHA